ncbi:hypothetical protein [Streptomyces sp. NBC_00199]|uniref:hypothetical protein n=1 Tax=Streptomyces sp. NBC_00199 TaxID=2975678 RepID=UPI00225A0FDD|nr:hypothetical protein [Streptomyces sp. NBC_00199]MCX5266403.1 hypothetical protein [Streptomyces sp. NBC_00199]
MAIRPSARWRARVDEEATELAAGTRAPSDAFLSELFPESLLAATEEALRAFELDVEALRDQDDKKAFEAIKRVVLVLNEINEDHDCAGYETQEREELCLYIDHTLTEHGIDSQLWQRGEASASPRSQTIGETGSRRCTATKYNNPSNPQRPTPARATLPAACMTLNDRWPPALLQPDWLARDLHRQGRSERALTVRIGAGTPPCVSR